jgi:hypothetical protein
MRRITWSGVAMHQGIVPNQPASHAASGFLRRSRASCDRVIITRGGEVTPVTITSARLFTIKPAEPKGEPEPTLPEPTNANKGGPNSVSLEANKGSTTATKSSNPVLNAMAYEIGPLRETTVTDSKTVKSAFEVDKPRIAKAVPTTGSDGVKPLKPGPISIFVSRKEGKLFVRKGFDPLFDVPLTFEQPDQPLGTHVFTALTVNDDNTTLRWNVMSMPGGGSAPAKKPERGKRAEVPPPAHASHATEALNRVSIPQNAVDRISQLMSPGASLIISDQGLGFETGKGTDFIVLTR